jgi:hypothetical protein
VNDVSGDAGVSSTHRPVGFTEFVVVIASIMALNPLAMDMMLPALPNIGATFHIVLANRPQEPQGQIAGTASSLYGSSPPCLASGSAQ